MRCKMYAPEKWLHDPSAGNAIRISPFLGGDEMKARSTMPSPPPPRKLTRVSNRNEQFFYLTRRLLVRKFALHVVPHPRNVIAFGECKRMALLFVYYFFALFLVDTLKHFFLTRV